MKHFFLLLAILVSSTTQAFSPDPLTEKNGTISGRVLDKNLNEPLPYVNIVIKNAAGDILTGGITNEDGAFNIKDIPEGPVTVNAQYIGYKTAVLNVNLSRGNYKVDLGDIKLEEDLASLDEVTVVAEVSTIQQKVDRKVITVGKDLTTTGPTASDIMNNLPSVNVDQQTGNINLRGNQNVRVMVDGKLSNIPTDQLLKQIPSTSIKSIELITNPSAKYNPEGMSGIINIVLHKNTNIGFNGNLNVGLTYDEEAKFNSSIDMNYRNGMFNLYGNYGNNISKNVNQGNIFRPESNSEQFFNSLDNRKNHLYKLGLDVYINDKNTVSFFTNQNISNSKSNSISRVLYYDDAAFNQTQNFNNENDNNSGQYNFNYKLDFNKEGHNIELEADYNNFIADEDANFDFAQDGVFPDYMDFVDTDRNRTTINLDYVNPLNDTSKLELGAEARLFNSDILYESTGLSYDEDGNIRPTPGSNFDYSRDIYSMYATYGKNYDKWSFLLGARIENVEVDAISNELDVLTGEVNQIAFENDYFELYPSAFFTYTPSETNAYQLSYSRRVDRPGLGQINPIREWSTPLLTSYGNIELEPQFTNSIETNYTRKLKKGSLTAGLFYRMIENEINRAVFIDRTDLNRIILTHDNFDNSSAYGFEVSSNYRPLKWWNFNLSFDLYSQTQKGITEILTEPIETATIDDIVTQTIEVDNVAWNLRMFNNFKATKNLTFSAFIFYRGQNRTIQFDLDPMFFVNLGARYSFLQNKATFSLNFNDVFDTMEFAFDGDNPFPSTGAFNWESQTVFAGLSYRFGGGKYRAKSRKQRDNNEKSGSGGMF
ncbi:MAG: TonB-dependent receptor [Bacteroidetes bacterium MedPE-SWsnd-G2]|nr:MAG: TonB-dependent receptor [Bacteroidetes bacterium MedPE-SWsnd-G2]